MTCCVCTRRDGEPNTCIPCVGQARRDLATILELVALGEDRLDGWPPRAVGTPSDGPRSAERPPLVGDLGVMLAPGSDGRSEDGETWRGDDPMPLEWLLCSWEDDWRETLGLPAAQPHHDGLWEYVPPLNAAARFLNEHTSWAAQNHLAFDEYATDLRQARAQLEAQLRDGDRPEHTAVACFDCGGQLVRRWTDEGLDDNRSCRKCQRVYKPEEYWLAVRAKMDDGTEEDAS